MKRWGAVVVLGVILHMVSHDVRAAETPPDNAGTPASSSSARTPIGIVVISADVEGSDSHPVEQAITAQLSDIDVRVYFHRVPRIPPAETEQDTLAAAQMVADGAIAAFLILPDVDGALRIVIDNDGEIEGANRLVDVSDGVPRHEAFAVIVRATVTAVSEQETLRQQAALAEASNTDPADNQATSAIDSGKQGRDRNAATTGGDTSGAWGRGWHLDSGLLLEFVSEDAPVTPGFAVGLGIDLTNHLWIRVGAVLFSNVTATLRQTTLTLRRRPFYLESGYQYHMGPFMLGGGAAICLDYAVERLSTSSSNVLLQDEGGELHASITVFFRSAWQFLPSTRIFLHLGATVPFWRTKYEVETSSGKQALLEIRPFQPVVLVGLQFHFF